MRTIVNVNRPLRSRADWLETCRQNSYMSVQQLIGSHTMIKYSDKSWGSEV